MSIDTSTDFKMTVIYDNKKGNPELQEGFGFSCFVEWGQKKILFDTGGDWKAFVQNSQRLGLVLNKTTSLLFSHGHWDHTSGLENIIDYVPWSAKVYVPYGFPYSSERKLGKYWKTTVVERETLTQIDEDVYSLVLGGSYWLTTIYEQSLLLKTKKGIVVITGCAHPGIAHIVQQAQALLGDAVCLVTGGFHLHHSLSCTSSKVVRQLQELGVRNVAPCHCTGLTAIDQFKKAYGKNYFPIETGTVLDLH